MIYKRFSSTIYIFVLLILINLISINFFTRIDFTKNKIFSLANVSKNTMKNLDDKVVIKAYFSSGMPGIYANTARYVKDLLSEFKALSKGNLQFKFIDPTDEEELKRQAEANGIYPVQIRALKNDKFEVQNAYMGIVISHKGKDATIPLVQTSAGLEYSLTSKIMNLSSQSFDNIAIMSQMGQYENFKQRLSENYSIESSDLTEPLDDISLLIVNAITDTLTENQLKNFDDFMIKKGKLILLLNKYDADINTGRASLSKSNIFDFLENYGVKIYNNLLKDAESSFISVLQRRGPFTIEVPVQYPFLIKIHRFNKQNVIVKNIEEISTAYVSEINSSNLPAGLSFEPIMFTSNKTGVENGLTIDVNYVPFINQNLSQMFSDSSRVISGVYSGKITSKFDKNSIQENANILLLTDPNVIMDNAGGRIPTNIDFIQNGVDYLLDKSDIIELRSREIEYRPLKDISVGLKKIVKWLNLILPPFLLLLFGLYIFRKKLQYKRMLRFKYE